MAQHRPGLLFWILLWLGLWAGPGRAQAEPAAPPLRVAVLAGPPLVGSPLTEALRQRLRLDPRTTLIDDPRQADVVWLLGAGPAAEQAAQARDRGAGVVIVAPGPGAPALPPRLGAGFGPPRDAVGDLLPPEGADPLRRQIAWRSAPKVHARQTPLAATPTDPLAPLAPPGTVAQVAGEGPAILSLAQAPARAAGQPAGRVVLLGLSLSDPSNAPLLRWGYTNYLLHALTWLAAGRAGSLDPFADWAGAPLPHRPLRVAFWLFLLCIWPLSLWGFAAARRAGRRAGPQEVEDFFARLRASNQAAPDGPHAASGSRAELWAQVGFARPLGGFFVLCCSLCVFLAPYIGLVQYVLPTYVQRFPEVDGMWGTTYEFFWWLWTLFDMGTSVALVKYFAELRTSDPAEALATVQLFNWWQILTGGIQVTLVGIFALYVVPHTEYALFSILIALYGLSQWPGFYFTLAYFFQAAQRYDYAQGLFLLQNGFLFVLGPVPFVLLGRAYGARHLAIGEAYGAVFGYAIGYYIVGVFVLFVSYGLYRRLGLGLRPLFLASFSIGTVRRVVRYGYKIVLSGIPYQLTRAIEKLVMAKLLLSYAEAMGLHGFIYYRFYYLFYFLYGWFEPAVAAFSEAHGAGKQHLLRYYVARYFQFGQLFCVTLFSFLMALAPTLIQRALAPEWRAAAVLVLPALSSGLFLPGVWMVDSVQKGCGRPGLNAILLLIEQGIRLGLYFVLVPRLQLTGVFLATALTHVLKAAIGWAQVHLLIVRLRFPFWALLGAPVLAGLLNYAVWRAAGVFVGALPPWGIVALSLLAGVASFPLCFALCGLCGGFDPRALAELQQGAEMSSAFRPVARLLLRAAAAGARGALLPARFPLELSQAAEREAHEIQAEQARAGAMAEHASRGA